MPDKVEIQKRKAGRRPGNNSPEFPARIGATMSVEMHNQLCNACDARNISIGEAVREALAAWLENQNPTT